jgi:hypothetical protein
MKDFKVVLDIQNKKIDLSSEEGKDLYEFLRYLFDDNTRITQGYPWIKKLKEYNSEKFLECWDIKCGDNLLIFTYKKGDKNEANNN